MLLYLERMNTKLPMLMQSIVTTHLSSLAEGGVPDPEEEIQKAARKRTALSAGRTHAG